MYFFIAIFFLKIIKILVDKLGWKVVGNRKAKSGYDGKIQEELELIKEL